MSKLIGVKLKNLQVQMNTIDSEISLLKKQIKI